MKKRSIGKKKLIFMVLSIFLTVGVPIINYIDFKANVSSGIDIGIMEEKYDISLIFIVSIGMIISICSYMLLNSPRYSVKRGILYLIHSTLDVIFLLLFSQFAIINVFSISNCVICSGYGISGIKLDFSQGFLLLIIISSLFILKGAFDLIDFKVNESYYTTLRRELRKKQQKIAKTV
ncbi:MAG: hypothetical protein ACFFE4_04055 [Candidatus Thorarchaeota archaeon]